MLYMEKDLRCCAGCGESVRRVTHGVNCHRRWPEFRADDSEANDLPRPERAREQQHVRKAGDSRRRVGCGPATPARYGESWMTRTPMSSGGTAHSLVARLYTQRHGEPRIRLLFVVRPALWTMRSERIEGHEWGTYVALGRSSVTEHGMAYGARARGSRSANSTRGGNGLPGRTGEP
jgi:hypothetical protein